MSEPVAIAGSGRIAQSLGHLLRERGECIAAVASQNPANASAAAAFIGGDTRAATYAELPQHAAHILVAVPDDAIAAVARTLAQAGLHRGVVLHTSGARGPEALVALASAGVACGALHPLQTVASPSDGLRVLPGVAFAIDGAPEALAWAARLVALLGGLPLYIPAASRPLYHAAAVMASNYLIALTAAAVMLMKEAGVDEATARRALEPLARTSIENAFLLGPRAALTGPIARGDAGTVREHLDALAKAPTSVSSLYRAAGLATLDIARQQGLPEYKAGALEEILRKGKRCD